ncbi:hypothetical protein GCM10019997_00340 [Prevotella corporis]
MLDNLRAEPALLPRDGKTVRRQRTVSLDNNSHPFKTEVYALANHSKTFYYFAITLFFHTFA